MTTSVPNLWEGKITRNVLTPLAILRTQAGNFDAETQGVLRAETHTRPEDRDGKHLLLHTFEIVAPGLHGYRRGVLTAEHAAPGAYPVTVRTALYPPLPDHTCYTQDEFLETLEKIFSSQMLATEIESLIAQINDASDPDADV